MPHGTASSPKKKVKKKKSVFGAGFSLVSQTVKNLPVMWETWVQSLV